MIGAATLTCSSSKSRNNPEPSCSSVGKLVLYIWFVLTNNALEKTIDAILSAGKNLFVVRSYVIAERYQFIFILFCTRFSCGEDLGSGRLRDHNIRHEFTEISDSSGGCIPRGRQLAIVMIDRISGTTT